MNIRYAMGLIFLAVGVLLTPFGLVGIANPGGGANIVIRLVFFAIGGTGIALFFVGRRLRKRALAENPALLAQLQSEQRPPTTVVAKPSFLEPRQPPQPELPAHAPTPTPTPPRRLWRYWVLFGVFIVVVASLVAFTWDMFAKNDLAFAVSVMVLTVFSLVKLSTVRRSRESR